MKRPRRYGVHKSLVERFGVKGDALHMFIAAAFATTISAVAAYATGLALLIPSLGPSIYLIFEFPMDASASPRNTLIGHFCAIAVGAGALWCFGLYGEPSVIQAGMSPARIGAAASSVAVTEAIVVLLRAGHPPAGASTLIVSLGLLTKPYALFAMAAAVVVVTISGWLINRACGIPVPVWQAAPSDT